MSKFNPAPKDVLADKIGKPDNERTEADEALQEGLEETFPGIRSGEPDAAFAVQAGQAHQGKGQGRLTSALEDARANGQGEGGTGFIKARPINGAGSSRRWMKGCSRHSLGRIPCSVVQPAPSKYDAHLKREPEKAA